MGLKDNLRELEALRRLLAVSEGSAAFGREVRLARTKRGMTLDAFAQATGIAKSYLSQIETGYAPPPRDDKVRRIAQALGLDPESLVARAHLSQLPDGVKERMARLSEVFDSTEEMIRALLAAQGGAEGEDTGAAPPPGGEAADASVDLDALHASGLLHHLAEWGDRRSGEPAAKVRRIPVINKVAAGYPQEFTDLGYPVGIADEYVTAPEEMSDPNAFAARVVGDSMEPKYSEGDLVIFSPAAAVESGDDCFVRFAVTGGKSDGETTFKRVFHDAEDCVRLQPVNEKYAPTLVRPSDIAAIFRAVARYEKL
jgi:phage repressor protein C with HTH and peptisase S24 domain/DNA-binding transcriptional regulator YiaG